MANHVFAKGISRPATMDNNLNSSTKISGDEPDWEKSAESDSTRGENSPQFTHDSVAGKCNVNDDANKPPWGLTCPRRAL